MKRLQVTAWMLTLLIGCTPVTCLAESQADSTAVEADADKKEENKESQVAGKDEMAPKKEVVKENMVPVEADALQDGTYSVQVESSSSMFKIVDCELTIKEGKMTAAMTMSGTGYLKLFMGTGEEAAKASEDNFIPYEENKEGAHIFKVPVEALDKGIDCAAFSKKKEKWYDRTLVFMASSLPEKAWKEMKMTTLEDLKLKDGKYKAEVTLEGGSGRASIETPAMLEIKDGDVTATIVWSSSNYDYMLVDGEKYTMENKEGNSTFSIPVKGFDYKMPVIADTVAMSTPHEISYTLQFDSATIEKAES